MWGATLALNGLIGAGVPQDWATHMIGHELTAFYGLDHAETLAVILPGVWRHRLEAKKAKLQKLAEKLHAHWPVDRDYLAPPTRGKLVSLDPGLIVSPPKGLGT